MILPGTTISPPYFLTPSRRPALSRPLRDEPPAFLCAISNPPRPPASPSLVPGADLGDPQHGLELPVAVFAAVIVPPLFLEDDDLVAAALLDQFGADRGAGQERRAGGHLGAVADHQHLSQLDRRAGLAGELLDRDDVVRGDLVLFAAGADHCEHDRNRYRVARLKRQARRAHIIAGTGLPAGSGAL